MGTTESKDGGNGRILMLGLDGAGKTTILFALKLGEKVETVPTVGFNIEEVTVAGMTLTIWDCGGQEKLRHAWRYYYQGTQAVIFVIDCSDRDRIPEAKKELQRLVAEELLQDISLLILANKQDLPHAMNKEELTEALRLKTLREGLNWHIEETVAVDKKGVYEGVKWLAAQLPSTGWCTIL